jgi:hypothetical protein
MQKKLSSLAATIKFDAVDDALLTTNPGVALSDNPNSSKARNLAGVPGLTARAQAGGQPGVTDFGSANDFQNFIDLARSGTVWEREPAWRASCSRII